MNWTMNLIRLQPIYQQRVWGGREFESLFGRKLPPDGLPYGESWEVVDRPEAQSIVVGGEFDGMSLHELWTEHRAEIFGSDAPDSERFPILLKILDARDDLSIQVHPPAAIAAEMKGEPKTEMWYVADATAEASLAVGVQPGVDADSFSAALQAGSVAQMVHRLPVTKGDFIFIPSGRLHAIGGGLVIFEIQQNSDTTYRVFDWNRVGLDGTPRELHVAESLKCIDFTDTSPSVSHEKDGELVACEYFKTERRHLNAGKVASIGLPGKFSILAIVSGQASTHDFKLNAGDHILVPASSAGRCRQLASASDLTYLEVYFQ